MPTPDTRPPHPPRSKNAWPLVLCLVGVDYFSTLAYLPSIAVEAAGPLAPLAAGGVVLITFCLALPVYWYVVGRSPDGRGATGLLEDVSPGWRGKLVVLTLLGFAAADFVITRSLSVADAALHLINNPHGQRLLARLPENLLPDDGTFAPIVEGMLHRLFEPQVAVTLGLSVLSFIAWQLLKRGITRGMLIATVCAVTCYLTLAALVICSALIFLVREPQIFDEWREILRAAMSANPGEPARPAGGWLTAWLGIALWSFPQMALGLSGFEMILNVVPQIRGGATDGTSGPVGRVRNARKLMVTSAAIMALYLTSAVTVTTMLVPRAALEPGGAAEHRALAYLAHGAPLADGRDASALNPLFGPRFGDLFDLSTAAILCLAGASVTMGLQNLLPHYLHRLGMEVSWAGKLGVIVLVLNGIVLVVTVVFHASPASQQWAYATSVLVLLGGAAVAASKDLALHAPRGVGRALRAILYGGAAGFFLAMTLLTVYINHAGLTIAASFVAAILVSSFISRWIRSTELRFEGFEFADHAAAVRWDALRHSGKKVLAPHRPGLIPLAEKARTLAREYRLDPIVPLVFIEVQLGDPSNFYQKPFMQIEREGELEVIRVARCVSVSHVLAAICLELCRDGGEPPEIIFGWSNEAPLAANLNFLLLGEGNIPWMVRELVRKSMPADARQPRILIG